MRHRLHVIGPGRAAGALAARLRRAGWEIGRLWARTAARQEEALRRIGGGAPGSDPLEVLRQGDAVLLGLPDREIGPAATRWAEALEDSEGVVFHLSGALSSEVLAPLRARGRSCGSLHPAFAFADRSDEVPSLAGVSFAVEGDPDFLLLAADLVRALEGQRLELTAATKALHHAATAVCSNFLVTVHDLAQQLEDAAGVPREQSGPALLSLARSTVDNLARRGSPEALTGPIERGDAAVVAAHLDAIGRLDDPPRARLLDLYRRLGLATVELARRKASLDEATTAQLRDLLEPGS